MSIQSRLSRLVAAITSGGSQDPSLDVAPPVRPSNIEKGFSSREVPDYNRKARVIYGLIVVTALLFSVLEYGAAIAFDDWGTMIVATVLLFFAGATEVSRRLVVAGRPMKAVRVFCASFLPSIIVVTFVKPDLVSVLTVAPFLAVVLAIPLASARAFTVILVGTWVTVVMVNILTELLLLANSMPDVGIPDYWSSGFRVAAVATAAAFVLAAWKAYNLGFWHYRYESSYDHLTRLPNEAYFLEQVREKTLKCRSEGVWDFALLFIKLEDFDTVNDALGSLVRDKLLYEVGRRLVLNVYGADTVARLHGDRFGVILEVDSNDVDVTNIARRLASFIEVPFTVEGCTRHVGASIAIVDSPWDFPDLEQLQKSVDTTLRTAKLQGRTCMHVDCNEAQQEKARMQDTGKLIQQALDKTGGIELCYQPVVGIASGDIVGFEARAYWQHPQDGPVPVRDYLSYIDDSARLTQVTEKALKECFHQIAQWRLEYLHLQPLALYVRLNQRQITAPGFVAEIGDLLEKNSLEGETIVLQMTEAELLKDSMAAYEVFSELRNNYGVCLCLDEFGSGDFRGSSSLTTVASLSPDLIRMHPSLAAGFGPRRREYEELLAQSAITVGHLHGADVVASGVRSDEQLIDLQDLGCDYADGDFFAGPLAKEMASAFLDQRMRWS